MNVLITHVYSSDNKGDAALLSVLISDLRTQFGQDTAIVIHTIDGQDVGNLFEGLTVKRALLQPAFGRTRSTPAKVLYGLSATAWTLAWAWVFKKLGRRLPLGRNLREAIGHYTAADLVVGVGGGYLRGKVGVVSTLNLIFTLHPIVLARLLAKPVILDRQSVGPFGNGFQAAWVGMILKKVNLILVREDISLALLRRLGVGANAVRAVDGGFLFESAANISLRERLNIDPEAKIVGITARDWLGPVGQNDYESAMAKLADHLPSAGYYVVFIAQVTSTHHGDDDRVSSRRIYELMERKDQARIMTEEFDHAGIKALYGQLDFVIGTRFHSVIFALTGYVPCIAIEYEHKTAGIMGDLGLNEWVVRMEDATAAVLIKLFERLAERRAAYLTHLRQVIPAYAARAKEAAILMKQAYDAGR